MVEAMAPAGTIGPDEVRALRAQFYPDGIVSRAEAERLFAINDAARVVCREWRDFFVEAVVDHVVHQQKPSGYVSAETAAWLIDRIGLDGTVETMTEVELLVTVLEKAKSSPETLVAFALRQVADAVIHGTGPLARIPGRLPNTVEKDEVDLLRRILFAFGGSGNAAVTRCEAEILFEINDRSVEEMNDPSWNDLFVKAMTNFVLSTSGYEVPSREEALRQDAFLDTAAVDLGGFFARMARGGLAGLFGDGGETNPDGLWADRNAQKRDAFDKAETVDEHEAVWLAERLGRDRLLHDNERTLLSVIKAASPSIHPALQPLVDRVA